MKSTIGRWLLFRLDHRHLINRLSTPLKTLAQQLLLYGRCQWVQIIALNLNFPLKFIRDISSCWIKHEKESKKIGRARSIYSWSRDWTRWSHVKGALLVSLGGWGHDKNCKKKLLQQCWYLTCKALFPFIFYCFVSLVDAAAAATDAAL